MRFLAFDYTEEGFFGRDFYFLGFQDGKIRGVASDYDTIEKRVYFNGENDLDCLNKAYEFCNNMKVGSTQVKLRRLLDRLKRNIELGTPNKRISMFD